jgi:general secretion pathway protein H
MMRTSPTGIKQRRAARGFSLIEILIVLTLLVTLTAILAPIMLPSPARTLRAAASDIATTLRETRREAHANHRSQRFVFDTDEGSYGIDGRPQRRSLPDGVSAELTTAESLLSDDEGGAIAFYPDGSASGGRVRLALDDRSLQVDIEWLTGRIRVQEPQR